MTPQEFKEKFKVGDKILNKLWDKSYQETITAIGKNSFLTEDDFSEKQRFIEGEDWIKLEPEKKPSEEIREQALRRCLPVNTIINPFESLILDWLDENWPKVVKNEKV